MPRIVIPARIDEDVVREIDEACERENRNRSNMVETLLREALAARRVAQNVK